MGWRADGIARARACGAVELELYRKPGFAGGIAVRRVRWDANVGGEGIGVDPEPDEDADARGSSRWLTRQR